MLVRMYATDIIVCMYATDIIVCMYATDIIVCMYATDIIVCMYATDIIVRMYVCYRYHSLLDFPLYIYLINFKSRGAPYIDFTPAPGLYNKKGRTDFIW